jgi:hypothetical protein
MPFRISRILWLLGASLLQEVCGKEANKSDYRMIGGSEHVRRFYNT